MAKAWLPPDLRAAPAQKLKPATRNLLQQYQLSQSIGSEWAALAKAWQAPDLRAAPAQKLKRGECRMQSELLWPRPGWLKI